MKSFYWMMKHQLNRNIPIVTALGTMVASVCYISRPPQADAQAHGENCTMAKDDINRNRTNNTTNYPGTEHTTRTGEKKQHWRITAIPAVRYEWHTHQPVKCEEKFQELADIPTSSNTKIVPFRISQLRRHQTMQKLEETKTRHTLQSKYRVDWKNPLGQGAFGAVFMGKSLSTGESVAIKKLSKDFTDNISFQREMDALLHLREAGGHPNICGLRENFDERGFYYLVMDLINGGEMFDRLCAEGAYSEADAARLIREVTCALAFLHGIGIVHGDMKPENIMLSSINDSDAVVKVVDFGCAQVIDPTSPFFGGISQGTRSANTPAYAPPEALGLDDTYKLHPAFDMWSLGVITYIMLTGVHPFDLHGNATNEEIQERVVSGEKPPFRNSPITAHLSPDAIALIEALMKPNPADRLNADQTLNNPWVRGETASQIKIAGSDTKLNAFRAYKTEIGEKVFKDMFYFGQNKKHETEALKRVSLLEHAFRALDPDNTGYVSVSKVKKLTGEGTSENISDGSSDQQMSLSEFSNFLSDNMKNRYFPKGHVIYHEGEEGHSMFFINSGSVEVYTSDGFRKVLREPGSFFGEGALLNRQKTRSASIRCLTPVHAIEISRQYFEKYLASDMDMNLDLKMQDRMRKRQRVKTMFQLQKQMTLREFSKGDRVFSEKDDAHDLFVLEDGQVDISIQGHKVYAVEPGSMWGEYSLIFRRPRNATSTCVSDHCRVRILPGCDFDSLLQARPTLATNLRDICYKREIRKAICLALKRDFPQTESELREVFTLLSSTQTKAIELTTIRRLLHGLDPTYTEQCVQDFLQALDLSESGNIQWDEFKRLFDFENET